MRRDKNFSDLGLTDADVQDVDQVVAVLVEHPKLMQRPVVIRGGRAVISRPPKTVLELF